MVRGIEPIAGGAIDLARHLRAGQHRRARPSATRCRCEDGRGATVELPGIILGEELARQLGVHVGDPVSVVSPSASPTAIGLVPRVKRFVVVGVFDSGMVDYDSALAYVSLADAQRFFDLGDAVTGVEVRSDDLYARRRRRRRHRRRARAPATGCATGWR